MASPVFLREYEAARLKPFKKLRRHAFDSPIVANRIGTGRRAAFSGRRGARLNNLYPPVDFQPRQAGPNSPAIRWVAICFRRLLEGYLYPSNAERMMTQLLGFGMPGPMEMMILLVILLVLFGGSKLPSLMRNLGRSANEFKHGLNDPVDDESKSNEWLESHQRRTGEHDGKVGFRSLFPIREPANQKRIHGLPSKN